MRKTFITLSCVVTLLVTVYTIHAVKDSQFRHKLGIPAKASVRDIGEIALSDGVPVSFQLDSGKDLTVTATPVTDLAKLATVPAKFADGVLQLNLSYTSKTTSGPKTESYVEHQTFMYPQRHLLALTLAQQSSHPVAVLMKPRLVTQ